MSKLKKSVILNNGVKLKNSVVMAPMTTWSSNDDYTVSDEELCYYKYRNKGAGMIITGCTHIQENGIGFTNEFAAYNDTFIPGLKKLATVIKENGAKAILQINHAGNKALPNLINGEVMSSSSVETVSTDFAPALTPKELSEKEIEVIIRDFGETTRRAIEAGFDGVEIHGAHGFLLQNFVSPFFNKRKDQWGGTLEKRLNFPIAVVTEIKRVINQYAQKEFILGYRISPDEPMEEALRIKDTFSLIDKLIELNVSYIHASLPDALQSKAVDATNDKTYLDELSQYINKRVLFVAAGTIQTPEQAELVIENGALPAIGHAFITDPLWMQKAGNGESENIYLTIKKDNVEELKLPKKLWSAIQNSGSWFTIE